MSKLSTMAGLAVLLAASVAWAQGAGGGAAPKDEKAAPAAAPPPAADMGPPKPAPELQQLNDMVGNWKCTGKGTMMGHEMEFMGTFKAAWDLDKNWLVAKLDGKAKGMPGSHKETSFYGYDPGSKMYVTMSVDNMGGFSMAKSKGWEGDKQEWTGKATMMGKEGDVKWTVTRKGPKEVALSGAMGGDSWEETCKK